MLGHITPLIMVRQLTQILNYNLKLVKFGNLNLIFLLSPTFSRQEIILLILTLSILKLLGISSWSVHLSIAFLYTFAIFTGWVCVGQKPRREQIIAVLILLIAPFISISLGGSLVFDTFHGIEAVASILLLILVVAGIFLGPKFFRWRGKKSPFRR